MTRIVTGNNGVRVETSAGTLRANAVIVTVSIGVLAAGIIAFEPALPAKKWEAFERISMETYNNIALLFSDNVFATEPDTYLTYEARNKRATRFLTNISSSTLTFGLVGGTFGRELKKIYGSAIEKKFVNGTASRWGKDPWTLGAYASAEPGAFHLRNTLRESLDDQLFFAGEACHRSLWATCAGAHLSGIDVAKEVIQSL